MGMRVATIALSGKGGTGCSAGNVAITSKRWRSSTRRSPQPTLAWAVLNDAIAQIELRLARDRDERERAELSTDTAIENSRSLIIAQANDVGRLLQQVANTCALIAERLEDDRYERRELADAIARLAHSPSAPLESGARPLGGTIFPALTDQGEPQPAQNEIDLRDPTHPRAGAQDVGFAEHRWTYGEPADETK